MEKTLLEPMALALKRRLRAERESEFSFLLGFPFLLGCGHVLYVGSWVSSSSYVSFLHTHITENAAMIGDF